MEITSQDRLSTLTRVGRALADPTRCQVLLAMLDGPVYPSELARRLDLTRANMSNHLSCLRGCGLVLVERQGRRILYRLADESLVHALNALTHVVLATNEDQCLVDSRSATAARFGS